MKLSGILAREILYCLHVSMHFLHCTWETSTCFHKMAISVKYLLGLVKSAICQFLIKPNNNMTLSEHGGLWQRYQVHDFIVSGLSANVCSTTFANRSINHYKHYNALGGAAVFWEKRFSLHFLSINPGPQVKHVDRCHTDEMHRHTTMWIFEENILDIMDGFIMIYIMRIRSYENAWKYKAK